MDLQKIDIKTMIVIGGLLVTFGGFYYGTQLRLDSLEGSVASLTEKHGKMQKQIQRQSKKLKSLEGKR